MFGALSVFGLSIKVTVTAWAGLDVQRDKSPPSAPLASITLMMLLAPVTNWKPPGVKLA
jgi:hypothetical protein